MSKKRSKLDPNRFKKEPQTDDLGLFAFDPVRQDVFKWGAIAGLLGGVLTISASFMWQMIAILMVALVCNYHIGKAAQYIPRWHAVVMAFLGLMFAIFVSIFFNMIAIMLLQTYGAAG